MIIKGLHSELDAIKLSPGDIIIEMSTNTVGLLVKRIHRVDIVEDDIYFWEILWTNEEMVHEFKELPQTNILEEEHLKLSIILDIIKWQSIDGGTIEYNI